MFLKPANIRNVWHPVTAIAEPDSYEAPDEAS